MSIEFHRKSLLKADFFWDKSKANSNCDHWMRLFLLSILIFTRGRRLQLLELCDRISVHDNSSHHNNLNVWPWVVLQCHHCHKKYVWWLSDFEILCSLFMKVLIQFDGFSLPSTKCIHIQVCMHTCTDTYTHTACMSTHTYTHSHPHI